MWAKVDRTGSCWVWTAAKADGYGRCWSPWRKQVGPAHRVFYEALVGDIPDGAHIDHLCFNPACVNPDHLRPLSPGDNNAHRRGAQVNNKSSGIRGVSFCRQTGRWKAYATYRGETRWGGRFERKEDAAQRAAELRAEMHRIDDKPLDER